MPSYDIFLRPSTTSSGDVSDVWGVITDPGTGAAIPVRQSGVCCITTGASGQTNTLAAPTFKGQMISLVLDTDGGGDRVVTVSAAFNQTGNNTITLNDAGDTITLFGATIAGALRWRLISNDGCSLSTV